MIRAGTPPMMTLAIRVLACLGPGILTWSCAAPPRPAASDSVVTSQPATYDGHYQGTVRLIGAGSGIDPEQCATDPHLALDVARNQFVYEQTHPRVAGSSPGLTAASTSMVYPAAIGPDGTFAGSSQKGGSISGTITGRHMTGDIQGLLCRYSFSADRV